jgi:hypothetical protein
MVKMRLRKTLLTLDMKKILIIVSVCLVMVIIAESLLRLHEKIVSDSAYSPQGMIIDLQALNYNDGVIPKAKNTGEYRIISFGDSFCHATVSPPYSYNGVLQQKLLEAGRTVRVVNLGEPISSFPQYLATMKNWLPQIDHDMILLNIYAINDLGEIMRREVPESGNLNRIMGGLFVDSQTGKKRMDHIPKAYPLRLMDYLYAYYHYFTEGSFISHAAPFPYTMAHGPRAPATYDRIVKQDMEVCDLSARQTLEKPLEYVTRLARFLSEKRKQGTRVLIMISPAEVQVNPALFQKTAAELGRDPDSYDLDQPNALVREAVQAVDPELDILDVTPLLRESMARGVNPYYPLDAHWDMAGNREVGDALADWILSRK